MNYEELEEALDELFPSGFAIETDSHGQLVIYTGLKEEDGSDGELVPMDVEESDEFESDHDSLDEADLDDED